MDGLDASLKTDKRVVGVTVQAACGQLHIISLWRLLAAAGVQMQSASSNCAKHADSERITISFTPVDATRADSILKSLEAQRWITHAMLHILSS